MKKKITKKTIKKTKIISKKIIKAKKQVKKKVVKTSKPKIKQAVSQLVNKKMMITELTRQYPECALIMMNHGLYCVGCGVAMYETLEDGAKSHGMTDLEIDSMIKEMNSVVNKR